MFKGSVFFWDALYIAQFLYSTAHYNIIINQALAELPIGAQKH